MKKIIDYFVV